jgi:hypothetical protein
MNSSNKVAGDKLEQFIVERRRFFYAHMLSEIFFWFAMVIGLLGGRAVILRTSSAFSGILSIALTTVGILVFAYWTLRERSVRRKEVFKLLKTLHTGFFDWVKSDVAQLIEKGRTDEATLTGSSE